MLPCISSQISIIKDFERILWRSCSGPGETPRRLVFLQHAASVAKNNTTKRDLTFVRVILLKQVPSKFQAANHVKKEEETKEEE